VANGCYTTGSSTRALTGYAIEDKTLTQEKCQALCFDRGFKYAAIEYGNRESPCLPSSCTADGRVPMW
jgi:hypothetical protein